VENSVKTSQELLFEVEELRLRLEEAEETLRAIGNGEVDAFVVSGPDGNQVFTLKGAEQPYRLLVETMNEGAATLAEDGTILYCNNRLAVLLQVPLEKLIGSRLDSYVAPGDHPLLTARLSKCTNECESDEIAMITGGGHTVPVLISCCANDSSGGQGISMVLTNLSQQKRNEEIIASERLSRSIIEQAGEAIIVCDKEGKIIQSSRPTHGLCGANPLLNPFDELFRLRIVGTDSVFSVRTPLSGGNIEGAEVEFGKSDGRRFHLLMNATPLKNTQNDIVGCVVMLADLSARKQAEEALARSKTELESVVAARTAELVANIERLKVETAERVHAVEALREKEQMLVQQSRQAAMGEMIGNIAHQWRQPLNSLALVVQQLALFYDLGELDRKVLDETIADSMTLINHMSKTIDDFRNFFRPDKEKVVFGVLEVVANTLALVDGSFKDQQIGVELSATGDPVIYGFRNEFAQVLLNILNNARDVLTERKIDAPHISITIAGAGGNASVTVTDNAGGIPEEIIDKIFDPYFTTKGPQKGTGVGLFMSKTIIEKNMGGRLSVCNKGNGAEFRIEV